MLRKYFNKSVSQKGVTLAELIVVTAIIGIFAGIYFFNYPQSRCNTALDLAARTLVNDLRWAQNAAMSGLIQSNPVFGYGLHTGTNNYTLFYADAKDNYTYSESPPIGKNIRTVNLSNQITISPGQNYDIFFLPPDPKTIITPNLIPPDTSITITLSSSGCTSKTVTVTTAGLIDY